MKLSQLRQIIKEEVQSILKEGPRLSQFIYDGMKQPALGIQDYTKQYGNNPALTAAIAQHYKGVNPKDIIIFAAKDSAAVDKIKANATKYSVTGVWASDKSAFIINGAAN